MRQGEANVRFAELAPETVLQGLAQVGEPSVASAARSASRSGKWR